MSSNAVRWPNSLWAAVTPSGPDCPELTGTQQADVDHHRRWLHRPVHRAASARGQRRCRDRRGRRAGLGRLGPQQRPGDPDAVAARSRGHHRAGTARPASVSSRMLRDSAATLFDVVKRYNIDAEQEQAGWVQPVHSPGRIKIAERRVRQWSKFGAPVELLSREQTSGHARLGRVVRRLLEQDRRPHQSAGAGARPCAHRARPRRRASMPARRRSVSSAVATAGW